MTLPLRLTRSLPIALALLTRRAEAEHPAAYDLRIYRDQLKEVERDLARGVINEADAASLNQQLALERDHFVKNLHHANAGIGISAFLNKEKPRFE